MRTRNGVQDLHILVIWQSTNTSSRTSSYLLPSIPIQISEIGRTHRLWRVHIFALDCHLQLHIIRGIIGILKVGQGHRIGLSNGTRRAGKWLESIDGNDPGTNSSAKVLGAKGTKGYIFPLLDVSGVISRGKNKMVSQKWWLVKICMPDKFMMCLLSR